MFDNQASLSTSRLARMGLGLVMALFVLMVCGQTASASVAEESTGTTTTTVEAPKATGTTAVEAPANASQNSANATAETVKTPAFTFKIESGWTAQEKAQLESWLSSTGPVMKTIKEVVGPPAQSLTIKVVKASTGNAGEYDEYNHQITLASLQLSVLVHELNHATRDGHILSDHVWEEGLARAGEKEVMRLLKLQGIEEPGYDTSHGYGYDIYYDQNNVPTVGVPDGNIYAEPGLTLLRYEQAGYAFTKILIENPQFISKFDAKVFAHPEGFISQGELVAMAAEVQPVVEGSPLATWVTKQHIFDTDQKEGCYGFERINQFTVDLYCTDQYGGVAMQAGDKVTMKIVAPNKEVLFHEVGITTAFGWFTFEPVLNAGVGRIKVVATAKTPTGKVKAATFYRQTGAEKGVFGIVTNTTVTTGIVSFSSPKGQFTPFSVPVTNGAFNAETLESLRGQFIAKFSGEGMVGEVTRNKDAAPYSLELTAHKVK